MRAIDDGAFVPALKTRRPFNRHQSARNGGIVDVDLSGARKRGDGERGVLFLMSAAQGEGTLIVRLGHELNRRFAFGRASANNFFGFQALRRGDNRNLLL